MGAPKAGAKQVQQANNLDHSCKMVPPAQPYEVEEFLSEHAVEAHAIEKLQGLDPRLQRVVIAKGSMADARDQTAVLIKRCTNAANMEPGDWVCPGCCDIQFKKKSACSQCSQPKP